jgi:hypothetical protein
VRGGGQAETRKTFKREMGGEQHKAIGRSRSKSKSREQHRKASKTEVSTMTRAITSESTVPESSEERRLWKKRGLLEVQIEKKEKMIDNTRQRLKSEWVVQGKQTLKDEADEIQREIDELREEITLVDREIRAAEKDACVEGSEEAKAIELAAKEAKEFAYALEQARQRKKEAEQTISEFEARVKEACRA